MYAPSNASSQASGVDWYGVWGVVHWGRKDRRVGFEAEIGEVLRPRFYGKRVNERRRSDSPTRQIDGVVEPTLDLRKLDSLRPLRQPRRWVVVSVVSAAPANHRRAPHGEERTREHRTPLSHPKPLTFRLGASSSTRSRHPSEVRTPLPLTASRS